MTLGDQVTYVYMLTILLYRVIGRIGMMTLHLGVLNGEIGMTGRAWDWFHDVSAMMLFWWSRGRYMCMALHICVRGCSYCCV